MAAMTRRGVSVYPSENARAALILAHGAGAGQKSAFMVAAARAMGGRIASQAAAERPLPISGLIFLGYPLHPPGKPTQRRDAHLPNIQVPMLFVQGSRDAFGAADEIRALLPRLAPSTELYELEGGDHSFKVPARFGKPTAVMD